METRAGCSSPLEGEMQGLNIGDVAHGTCKEACSNQGSCACDTEEKRDFITNNAPIPSDTCTKCKERHAECVIRKQARLCYTCLEVQIATKVRTAVRGRSFSATDSMAVALSGGPGSVCLLHVLHSIRSLDPVKREKYKIPFNLNVINIVDAAEPAAERAAVECEAADLAKFQVPFHRIPLDAVFRAEEPDEDKRKDRLAALLDAVRDPTGRDDLKTILRLHLLVHTATELGCGTLALGHDSTALAVRAISAAAKGCGYSMPSDMQTLDARFGSPVLFYPMKDISREEVDALSSKLGLQGRHVNGGNEETTLDKHNVNSLAAIFVEGVLRHNPGAVNNIMSTVSKLEPFAWNHEAAATSEAQENKQHGEKDISDVLCPLCCAPLAADEVPTADAALKDNGCVGATCDSCRHQIFGCLGGVEGAGEQVEKILRLLPQDIVRRMEALALASSSS